MTELQEALISVVKENVRSDIKVHTVGCNSDPAKILVTFVRDADRMTLGGFYMDDDLGYDGGSFGRKISWMNPGLIPLVLDNLGYLVPGNRK